MTPILPEPSAALLLRVGLARIADAGSLVLFTLLAWQVMFGGSQRFESEALVVGLVGGAAAWLSPGGVRTAPVLMLAYAGVALVSAAVHQWPGVSVQASPEWWLLIAPAWHLVQMVVFVAGSAHLLRTPRRLAVVTALLALAILVIAVQTLYDRTSTNFVYQEHGAVSLPSVSQWGGMHQIGMLLTIGFPLVFALATVSRSRWRVAAGVVLGAGVLLVAVLTGSRSAIATIVLSAVAMGGISFVLGRSTRWRPQAYLLAFALLGLGVWIGLAAVARSRPALTSLTSGRAPIWRAAAQIAADHPLLGVGPGNYMLAMIDGGYAERFLPRYAQRVPGVVDPGATLGTEQAHNLLLHVAAETGIAGALCLLAFWVWLIAGCWRALGRAYLPLLSCGLLMALAAFLLRCMYDNFLDALGTADRTRVLAWMLFAAALALRRQVPTVTHAHHI